MPAQRTILFIDYQNIYRGARRIFFTQTDHHTYGQIDPIALGNLLCSRPPPGQTRTLTQVRVYTGRPDASKQPKTYGAHRKQCSAWEAQGTKVIFRPLRYLGSGSDMQAGEKGIDVALAIDYIALALDGAYDAGIIASTDTDLKPALEFVYEKCRHQCRCEVMAWRGAGSRRQLSIAGVNLWCHWLNRTDYDQVADLKKYSV
ncbi:NYN domain-containing protein [Acidobacteria bacterium AH-259-D05]|nr:NYN domain-containing protein [Acidobacteria bacterium AH-259-D05]